MPIHPRHLHQQHTKYRIVPTVRNPQFSSLAIQRELHINYNVVSYILRALHIKQECEPNYDLFSHYRKNSVETQSLLPSNFAAVGTTTDKNSLENKDFRINIVNYFYINIRQILKSAQDE